MCAGWTKKCTSSSVTRVHCLHSALSIGDVLLAEDLKLKYVLYVPGALANLFSVKQATSNGATIIFEDNKGIVRDEMGNVLLEATSRGGLYCIQLTPRSSECTKCTHCRDVRLLAIQQLFRCLELACHRRTITDVAGSAHSLSPQLRWQFAVLQHSLNSLLQRTIEAFCRSILLRCIWCCQPMNRS